MAVSPRRPKGPPLNALRAFEAAARLESFMAAAEELGVTPGAVSQHVKALEGWADVPLFQRNAQGVALTPEGRGLLSPFTEAFDKLASATQALRNLSPDAEIHIAALPSVAQLWLPPRLGKLRTRRPDLKVSVTALETPPSLSRDLYDLSLFIDVPAPDANQVELASDSLFPVAAPDMAGALILSEAVLLHDQTWSEDWTLWSTATAVDVGDPSRGPSYSLYGLAVEEAKAGAGVLMAHSCLVESALKAGSLRRVSDAECETGKALLATLPHPSLRRADVDDVVAVLMEKDMGNEATL